MHALEEGLLIYGSDGRALSCNAAATRILGLPEEELLVPRRRRVAGPDRCYEDGTPLDARRRCPRSARCESGLPQRDVVLQIVRAGRRRGVGVRLQPPARARGRVAPVRRGLRLQRHHRAPPRAGADRLPRLPRLLTKLPNRALLDEHLALGWRARGAADTSVALLYVDLDDFKAVNDCLGHAAGDELLRRIAVRLRGVVRSTDLLARQGGDEFLILLTDLERDPRLSAEAVAKQVEQALLEPFMIADAEFEIGSSIGICIYPHDANDADTLLRHADAAMYEVKQAGRGGIASYGGDSRHTLARLSLTSKLRRALQRDDFVVHYQPLVVPATGELVAFEALVRWQDAERGIVGPNEFIPLAEDAGLIEAIGGWVLNAVCAQLRDVAPTRASTRTCT